MESGSTKKAETRRKKLIQLIHVGKSKLGLDDEAYRAYLFGVCGKESASKMTIREMESALKGMRTLGFPKAPSRVRMEERGGASLKQLEYIKGMWAVCARNKSETAMLAFVNRIAHVRALRFLNVESAQQVILALRDMMAKAGFDPDSSEVVNAEKT